LEIAALDALCEVDLLLGGEQPHLADVLQEELKGVGGHVRLQVERALGLAPRALVGRSLDRVGRRRGGIDLLDELDLGLLEIAVELLDVGLVEVDLAYRAGDLAVGEHADLLTLDEQALYLFELLEFSYRHRNPFPSVAPVRSGIGRDPGRQRSRRAPRPAH